MRIRTLAATAAIALAAASLAACSSSTPAPAADTTTNAPTKAAVSLSGTFAGLNGKSVEGTVMVTDSTITFADFSSDEGPDLHVYLTNGTDESDVAAGMEIAAIGTDAAQTFTISGVDVTKYTDVVIHCDKAQAVFGAAPIS